MEKAQVYAKHKYARIGPKKVAVVMDVIRGLPLHEAKKRLAFDQTKAAKMILKVLKSAEANASNNHGIDPSGMYVSHIFVDGAPMYKRGRAGSRGRYDPIFKRNSHITVGLSSLSEKKEKK